MKTKTILTSILAIFVTFTLSAQNNTQPKVVVYKPFVPTEEIDKDKDVKVFDNMMKWNYFMLVRGAFLINYERRLNHKFSAEFGFGPTYRDYIFEAFKTLESNNSDYKPTAKLGLMAEGYIRFYPSDGDMDGFYVSTGFRARKYNVAVDLQDYNGVLTNTKIPYNMNEACFTLGYQWEDSFWGTTSDWYFGVSYETGAYRNIKTDDNNNEYAEKQNFTTPTILCGWKIGFPF